MLGVGFVKFIINQEFTRRNSGQWSNFGRQFAMLVDQADDHPWGASTRDDLIRLQESAITVQELAPIWFSEDQLEALLERIDLEIWRKNPLEYPGRKA